jgi:ceramide glucosyltransferase
MIEAVILASMALELLLFLGFFLHSRAHVCRSFPGQPAGGGPAEGEAGGPSPRAAIIVPLTGNSPEMKACLKSLLTQDYPNFETILVTRDLEDPATPLVRDLLAGHRQARHLLSGPATTCSQKNHNILAGLAALDDSVDILVFCDSTHQAPPHFLRDLVRPLHTGEAVLTTGFHRIAAGDFRLGTLGMLQINLVLHLMHGFARIVHPWGGATAIRRSTFEAGGIRRLWSENVVDDLSMGAHLLRSGIRVKSVATAVLTTNLAGQTVTGWVEWLTRQLLYLKYCLPGYWLGFSLAVCLLLAPVLAAVLACLGGLLGLVSAPAALTSAGFLLLLTGVGAWYRTLVPQRIPLRPWLAAFYGAIAITCWSYLKTWCTDTISWRGISYRVTWGGRVRQVILTR